MKNNSGTLLDFGLDDGNKQLNKNSTKDSNPHLESDLYTFKNDVKLTPYDNGALDNIGFDINEYEYVGFERVSPSTLDERFGDLEPSRLNTTDIDFDDLTTKFNLYDKDGNQDTILTSDPGNFGNLLARNNADLYPNSDLDLLSPEGSAAEPLALGNNSIFVTDSDDNSDLTNSSLLANTDSTPSSLIDLNSDSTFGNTSISNTKNIPGDSTNNFLPGDNLANNIEGLAGDDYLDGAGGADTLSGGSGNDLLVGGLGDDFLMGGSTSSLTSEYDNLHGGLGADTFAIGNLFDTHYEGNGYATIMDFSQLQGDLIQLHGSRSDYTFTEVDGDLEIRYGNNSDLVGVVNGIESLTSDDLSFV